MQIEQGFKKECPSKFKICISKLLGWLSKKDKQSIYESAEELIRLRCYWSWKREQPEIMYSTCQRFWSWSATKMFGLSKYSVTVGMIGYIEHLEKENKTLKESNETKL